MTEKAAKTARKNVVIEEIDPNIRKAVLRRYGKKSTRRGGRYATPKEIAAKPEAWDGDVSDMYEEEIDNGE